MQCEIAIEDVDIALEQAALTDDAGRYFLDPLSFNPSILIEGEEIRSRTALDDGDIISIGEYRLIFSHETDPPSEEAASAAETDDEISRDYQGDPQINGDPIVTGDSPQDRFAPPVRRFRSAEEIAEEIAAAKESGDSKSVQEGKYCLIAIAGPFEGELYDLREGENVIGSGSDCHIRLDRDKDGKRYGTVAASHASISFRDGEWVLEAHKSQHGTAHNGILLSEGQGAKIEESDEREIRHAPEGSVFRFAKRGRLDISPPSHFEPAVYRSGKFPVAMIVVVAVILLLIVVVILAYK